MFERLRRRPETHGAVLKRLDAPVATGEVVSDAHTPSREFEVSVPPSVGAEEAVRLRGLTKKFGAFTAVDGVDLEVARGEIYGFLGPNGCGKTTTIRMLTGSLTPTSGEAFVLGEDARRHPKRIKRRIGYMSQKFSLFEDLSVAENLRFYAGVYGIDGGSISEVVRDTIRVAGLTGREDELPGHLSVGVRQRLALGAATIHHPQILFLDEPTSGVDPVARREFWDRLYALAAGGVTLFVTTHYMEEASNCTRLAFMYRGRIIADGTPSAIRRETIRHRIVEVAGVDDTDAAMTWMEAQPDVTEVYAAGARLHVSLSEDATDDAHGGAQRADPLAARLTQAGFGSPTITPVDPTMEDVFVHLATRAESGPDAEWP